MLKELAEPRGVYFFERREHLGGLVTTYALRIDTGAFREVLLEYPQVALRVLDDVTTLLGGARSDASQHAMSRLRKDGIIDSGRRWTSIFDRDKLAAIIASGA